MPVATSHFCPDENQVSQLVDGGKQTTRSVRVVISRVPDHVGIGTRRSPGEKPTTGDRHAIG